MEVGFERRQPCLGAVEPMLRGIRRRNTHLREIRRLLHQLSHGRFMDVPQRGPFLLDDSLKIPETLTGVLLQVRADVAQLAEMRFELTDRSGVSIGGGLPPLQNGGAVFSERREALFERSHIVGRSLTQTIDLRLETRETLLKFCAIRLHINHVRE
jgi:hypothetical protein